MTTSYISWYHYITIANEQKQKTVFTSNVSFKQRPGWLVHPPPPPSIWVLLFNGTSLEFLQLFAKPPPHTHTHTHTHTLSIYEPRPLVKHCLTAAVSWLAFSILPLLGRPSRVVMATHRSLHPMRAATFCSPQRRKLSDESAARRYSRGDREALQAGGAGLWDEGPEINVTESLWER